MVFSILTLFPEVFKPIFSSSIIGRAQRKKQITIRLINIRHFASDSHHTVDDAPYGGGTGMLLKINVLYEALQSAKIKKSKERIILLDPTGDLFNQSKALQLIKFDHLILICGHYEGVDYRINHFIYEKLSIGRYILAGGEIPAMVVSDVVTRLLPGVLKKEQAVRDESFSEGENLEFPQFTRPEKYRGHNVPPILLSGDHQKIAQWRQKEARKRGL